MLRLFRICAKVTNFSQKREFRAESVYGIYNLGMPYAAILPRKPPKMFPPKNQNDKFEKIVQDASKEHGFTLLEVMASAGVLALISVAMVSVLLQMNSHATVARLKTLATLVALNQIELVSTDAPFSPPDAQIPVELVLGDQAAPIFVYDDPNSEQVVTGTMTTTVDDPNYWQNGYNLHLRRVTVTVTYQFRNRNYLVRMHTIRASDV